jgi:hypothetical protein
MWQLQQEQQDGEERRPELVCWKWACCRRWQLFYCQGQGLQISRAAGQSRLYPKSGMPNAITLALTVCLIDIQIRLIDYRVIAQWCAGKQSACMAIAGSAACPVRAS